MSVDSDLAAMLTGWDSKVVEINGFTGRGILDELDVPDLDGGGNVVVTRKTTLKLRRSDFANGNAVTIARGDTATVDDVAYSVADVRIGGYERGFGGAEIDGRELHLFVRKV